MPPTYDRTFADLAEIYLEDSWVLEVGVRDGALVFDLEAVLTERHPRYRPPRPGEMYCYHRGRLTVSGRPVLFRGSERPPNRDPDGELDRGNIDVFAPLAGGSSGWRLEGEWGEAVVGSPAVVLDLGP
ncbi:hypothetical protein [Actinoallomurus iriomotensis]|uniref:Uncharacterized protein n=1 Tax=Actinoallomurus iriomotensis TaxID=478107 RepID=A0A9W6S5T7_9ACTN|nr:hypothetical protein [Actinoallomurus iriomotensis]GLY87658.1 hypothetical protein Airi02_055870 [Actinoallomurus iriomotensis]